MKTLKISSNSWLYKKVYRKTSFDPKNPDHLNLCVYGKYVFWYLFQLIFVSIVLIPSFIFSVSLAGLLPTKGESYTIELVNLFFNTQITYNLTNPVVLGIGFVVGLFMVCLSGAVLLFLLEGVPWIYGKVKELIKYCYRRKFEKSEESSLLFQFVKDKYRKVCSKIEII